MTYSHMRLIRGRWEAVSGRSPDVPGRYYIETGPFAGWELDPRNRKYGRPLKGMMRNKDGVTVRYAVDPPTRRDPKP